MLPEQPAHLAFTEGAEFVYKADPGIELRIERYTAFDPGQPHGASWTPSSTARTF